MKKLFTLLMMALMLIGVQSASATTVYYVNTNSWTAVNCYYYNSSTASITWPGDAMTKTSEQYKGYDVYSYNVPNDAVNCIFSNNGSSQTADLTVPTGSKDTYYNGSWIDRSASATTDLYVIGSFNNWGLEDANYKMTTVTDGEEYTFDFGSTELKGANWKINDGSWTGSYNIGSGTLTEGTFTVYNDANSNGITIDSKYNSATNVKITLKKDSEGNWTITATGTFTEGETEIPDLYLRGADDDDYGATDAHKFTCETKNAKWTLTYDVTSDFTKNGFKIADANWGDYNFGSDGTNPVTVGTAYTLVSGNNNLWFTSLTPGNYTFTVTKSGDAWTLLVTQNTAIATVTSVGYATFVAPFNISSIPSGVEAYAAQKNDETIHLESVTAIPAGTAVVLKNAGEFTFTPTSESVELGTTNDLVAATSAVTADGNQYVLAQVSGVVGFNKVKSGTTIAIGKGYLDFSSGAKSFYSFDDETDGISNVNANVNASEAVYNLAGQCVAPTTKGIIILNGKKYINK